MLDDGLRRRLEALNRGALTEDATVRTAALPLAEASSPVTTPSAKLVGKPIPGILRRGEAVATSAGEHLRIRLPIDALWPGGSKLVAARQEQLRQRLAEA